MSDVQILIEVLQDTVGELYCSGQPGDSRMAEILQGVVDRTLKRIEEKAEEDQALRDECRVQS